jgi:hypothetical protein
MRPPRPLILSLALVTCSPALAQDTPAWRGQVDRLVDRWTDDVGSARVERALNILEEHLQKKRNRKDGEALLEKARLLLSRPIPKTADAHQAGILSAAGFHLAATTADLAASYLTGERRQQAQALGCLAANYQLRAELERMELIPGNPKTKALLAREGAHLQRRRDELAKSCGGIEDANTLLALESQRLELLRQIDRMGTFPQPIGMDDTEGKPVDLTLYSGRVLLVVFWSSSLGDPAVLSKIEAIRKELKGEDFDVLGINLDDKRDVMTTTITDLGLGWRQCFDGEGIAGRVARAWGVRAMPDGVLIDRTGRVRYLAPWQRDLTLAARDLLARKVASRD